MGKRVNPDFQKGLEKKRIVPFAQAIMLVADELRAAKDDLTEAQDRLSNQKFKYTTIAAYYSMFHSARALIYSKGYREKSHYYLLVALRALFVDTDLLPEQLVVEFHDAMVLREDADYHAQFSKDGAKSVVFAAIEMLSKAKKLLNK